MKTVELIYNPFTVETEIFINDKRSEGQWSEHRRDRLQAWLEQLFPYLADECNDDMEFRFHGTEIDYNDVREALHEFQDGHDDIAIHLMDPILNEGVEHRIEELQELFEYLQESCPFEDLKTEQIRENFNKAMGSEFEVSVIATMSSGKSTLINAMLGTQLMPSKNEACTATIAEIKDVDGMEGFTAECRGRDGRAISGRVSRDLTSEEMAVYNEDPEVSTIKIRGDIPFVSSKNMQLVLLDTPGPNNSRNEDHKERTFRIIKEKSMPMVLYVLNATQLATNDDQFLLRTVASAMKVGGKQAKDRFIFAVNKIDQFDVEGGDSVDSALRNVRKYLQEQGIENPNIYPVTAEYAKVIRLEKNGAELSRKQRRALADADALTEQREMHLEAYAPLSKTVRGNLSKMLEEAQALGDQNEENLIHTGVPGIELTINEYLDKYALTNKVKTAVDTFLKKIQEKEMLQKLAEELQQDQQRCDAMQTQIAHTRKQLKDGQKAESFRQRIQKLDMTKEAKASIRKMRTDMNVFLSRDGVLCRTTEQMSVNEVNRLVYEFQQEMRHRQMELKSDLDNIIQGVMREGAYEIIKEYRSYVRSLIQGENFEVGNFSFENTELLFDTYVPDTDELIEQYQYETSVKVGERWVENTDKAWYKFWTWFDADGWNEDVMETRQYVDGTQLLERYIAPIKQQMQDNISEAQKKSEEQAEAFKTFFLGEIDRLKDTLDQKLKEMEKLTENAAHLQASIQQNKKQFGWLNDFQNRLNGILKVE